MSARTDDTDYETLGMDAAELDRYAEVTLESGGVIIYDRDNESAWIQADEPIELDSMA